MDPKHPYRVVEESADPAPKKRGFSLLAAAVLLGCEHIEVSVGAPILLEELELGRLLDLGHDLGARLGVRAEHAVVAHQHSPHRMPGRGARALQRDRRRRGGRRLARAPARLQARRDEDDLQAGVPEPRRPALCATRHVADDNVMVHRPYSKELFDKITPLTNTGSASVRWPRFVVWRT
jgi:hypothetical protein